MRPISGLAALGCASLILLAGCGGGGGHNDSNANQAIPPSSVTDSDSATGGNNGGSTKSETGGYTSVSAYFSSKVQANLNFCRTCHVPGGIADKSDQGKRFMLSAEPSQDYGNVQVSWEKLGKGVTSNRILTMPSDATLGHSGGQPWPVGSPAYNAMATLLSCWDNPSSCTVVDNGTGGGNTGGGDTGGDTGSTDTNSYPLLGSSRGGHMWTEFCAGKSDDTELPTDPRELVQPDTSAGKAVYFNAFWKDCHVDMPASDRAPTTCGDFRARYSRGRDLIEGNGAVGAGTMMGGDSVHALMKLPASSYSNLWKVWGLKEKPADFDKLVEQRYGFAFGDKRNPYPLPGEDPNATDGGSGQLPMAFTQIRKPDGTWTGQLGLTCAVCHSARIESSNPDNPVGELRGMNGLSDLAVFMRDTYHGLGGLVPFSMNRLRGTGNITNFQIFGMLTLFDKEHLSQFKTYLPVFKNPSTGTEDSPTWWNLGHRPYKFFDGGMPADAQRIELSAYFPLAASESLMNVKKAKVWIEQHDQDSDAYLMTVKSPAYPGTIDTKLAEQGAILFHTKNLWADNLNNPVAKPSGGNGSCASCHGAYSPRFTHDTNYLATPVLEGMASNITPLRIINTDPRRLEGNNQIISNLATKEYFAYNDQPQCGDQNLDAIRGDRELGYLAPPLYGVWASAPYFHNGSVPNIWGVLKPSERPTYWSRVSTPTPVQQSGMVMGFDTNFERAYDSQKIGWKYNELNCGDKDLVDGVNCDADDESALTPSQQQAAQNYSTWALLFNFESPLWGNKQIERRKIYNTHVYSQGNQGHEFTAVLTDDERLAIMEYLKTL